MSEFHRLKNELSKLNKKLRKVEEKCSFQDIIGRDQELLKVIKTARIAAATPATIMLRGESLQMQFITAARGEGKSS